MKRILYIATALVAVSSFVAASATAAVVAAKKAPVAKAQQRVLSTAQAGQQVYPISVAPVLGRAADGKPILGPWQAYNRQATAGPSLWPPAIIDAFEGDELFGNPDVCDATPGQNFMANGPNSGGVSPACDFGGGLTGDCGNGDTNRWFLGTGFNASGAISAMSAFADGAADVSSAQCFTWFQAFGSDGAPPCETYVETIVILSVYDNTVASLIDGTSNIDGTTLGDGFVDGVAFNFGPIAIGGYYWTNVDLRLEDPELHLGIVDGSSVGIPADGALEILLADGDGAGGAVVGSYGQPMLWSPKDASLQGAFANGIVYYDGDGLGAGSNCASFNAEYDLSNDAFGIFDDASWPGGCPLFLVPMVGLYGGESAPPGPNCPTSFTLNNGVEQAGTDFANSCVSDDVWWGLQSTTFAAAFSPPAISVTVEGTVPVDGTPQPMLTFTCEGHPTLGANNVFITVAIFNYTTGQFEQSVFAAQPNGPPDAVYSRTADNTDGDYVSGGEVRARVTCSKTTTGPTRLFIDSMFWELK